MTKKLITQAFQAFISSSRYLDYLLNIDNPYFEGIVGQINLPEIQLNKASASDINAIFLDLHIPVSISHGFASFKICYKPNDFDFDVVNFSFFFWMGTLFVLPLTGFTFLNLFDLQQSLFIWHT